jgi:hypothetical protein
MMCDLLSVVVHTRRWRDFCQKLVLTHHDESSGRSVGRTANYYVKRFVLHYINNHIATKVQIYSVLYSTCDRESRIWVAEPYICYCACVMWVCVRACAFDMVTIYIYELCLHCFTQCVENRLWLLEVGNLVSFLFYFCNVLLVSVLFRTRYMRDHV